MKNKIEDGRKMTPGKGGAIIMSMGVGIGTKSKSLPRHLDEEEIPTAKTEEKARKQNPKPKTKK